MRFAAISSSQRYSLFLLQLSLERNSLVVLFVVEVDRELFCGKSTLGVVSNTSGGREIVQERVLDSILSTLYGLLHGSASMLCISSSHAFILAFSMAILNSDAASKYSRCSLISSCGVFIFRRRTRCIFRTQTGFS